MKELHFLPFLFCATFSTANIDIQNEVWLVSHLVTGSVWQAERCLKIEEAAKERKWVMAAKLASTTAVAKEVKGAFLSNGEPLDLVLESMAAVYSQKTPALRRQAPVMLTGVLLKYHLQSAGNRWFSYKYAQQALRNYYVAQNDLKNALRFHKEAVFYDPWDKTQIGLLLSFGEKHPETTDEILDCIFSLRRTIGPLDNETTLNLILKGGFSESEKAMLLEKWLETNVNAFPDLVEKCLDAYLSVTNSLDRIAVRNAIANVRNYALRQRNEKGRMPVLVHALRFIKNAEAFAGENKSRQAFEVLSGMKKESREWSEKMAQKESGEIPWKSLIETSAYLWSPEQRQRETNALALSDYIECFSEIEEFEKRLSDSSDNLEDCEKYRRILAISGVAGRLYWLAEQVFWRGDYKKAHTLMNFFLLPENSDGFTRGAAHFFIGRMLHERHCQNFGFTEEERVSTALGHLLCVHKFPTCLTYTSYAYIMASELFYEHGEYYSALVLSMVDVPSVDFSMMEWKRHRNAALYSQALRDRTNYVKNVQLALRYGGDKAEEKLRLSGVRWQCGTSLWHYCQEHPLDEDDFDLALTQTMENENESGFMDDIFEAATHRWPKNFEIPMNIATNRVLNNNVFQNRQKR